MAYAAYPAEQTRSAPRESHRWLLRSSRFKVPNSHTFFHPRSPVACLGSSQIRALLSQAEDLCCFCWPAREQTVCKKSNFTLSYKLLHNGSSNLNTKYKQYFFFLFSILNLKIKRLTKLILTLFFSNIRDFKNIVL
jgi:hypothetical protein